MRLGSASCLVAFGEFLTINAFSWEPKANVRGCQRLLDSFWDHIGIDDEDYADGFQVEAKKGWISALNPCQPSYPPTFNFVEKEKGYFKNWFEHQTVEDQEGKPEDSQEEDKLKVSSNYFLKAFDANLCTRAKSQERENPSN